MFTVPGHHQVLVEDGRPDRRRNRDHRDGHRRDHQHLGDEQPVRERTAPPLPGHLPLPIR